MLSEKQYRSYGKEIIPGFLFLGCRYEADDLEFLREHAITHILNVAEECSPPDEVRAKCRILHIQLRDSPRTDVRGRFNEAFAFIDEALCTSGSRVLVHCFEGRNRSAAFVLGYVMRGSRLELKEALARVREVRSLVDPNIGFMKQLRDFELELFGNSASKPSLPIDENTCRDLLDLELITADELGRYTNLTSIEYEGNKLEVPPPLPLPVDRLLGASSVALRAPSAPAAKAKAKSKAASATTRGAPKAAAGGTRRNPSAAGSAGRRSPSPRAAASPSGPRTQAVATRSAKPKAASSSSSRGRSSRSPERPPRLAIDDGPLHDAVLRLFDALDTTTSNALPKTKMAEARTALASAVVAAKGSKEVKLETVDKSWSDGSLSAFSKWMLQALAPLELSASDLVELSRELSQLAASIEPPFRPVAGTDDDRQCLSAVIPDQLFLTNWRRAADREAVKAAGVTHVLSMGSEFEDDEPLKDLGITYLCVIIDDDEDQAEKMMEELQRAVNFVDACIEAGGKALVHCAAGISRSATVVLAYLVEKQKLKLMDAFKQTRQARPVIWPNKGFMAMLIRWEEGKRRCMPSMRISQYKLWSEYDPDNYHAAKTVDRD